METINKILIILGLIIASYFVGYFSNQYNDNKNIDKTVINYDTTYNKLTLDSIQYNIKQKDSVIYNIKIEMQYEIKEAINDSDSMAISRFYKLVTEC